MEGCHQATDADTEDYQRTAPKSADPEAARMPPVTRAVFAAAERGALNQILRRKINWGLSRQDAGACAGHG